MERIKNIVKTTKKHIQTSQRNGKTFVVFLLALMITKLWVITTTYHAQLLTLSRKEIILNYVGFLTNDTIIMGAILTGILLNHMFPKKGVKILINIFNIGIILLFFIDIITIWQFQSRLSIPELSRFLSTSNGTLFFKDVMGIIGLFFFGLVGAFFGSQKLLPKFHHPNKQLRIAGIFFALAMTLGSISLLTQKYPINPHNIFTRKEQDTMLGIPSNKTYEDFFTKEAIHQLTKKNIIVVFAESFSAIDSKRTSNIDDNLPLFDKIQEEGITFTNMHAHGCTSEKAHIALLEGIEPRSIDPNSTNQNYDTYTTLNQPLPTLLKNNGYKTAFLSTVSLDFLNQKSFLENMGFQEIMGEENFKNQKKYVFDAAPDYDLYEKALSKTQEYLSGGQPFLFVMQTISSHKPYNTPYGQNSESAWTYSDRTIYTFYQKLKKTKFFDNGMLLIIGDHRKMEPLTDSEVATFGDTALSKTVATLIDKNIPKNTFSNIPLQHIDFYYYLSQYGSGNTLQRNLRNNPLSKKTNRDRNIRYCPYVENGYQLITSGTTTPLRREPNHVATNYFKAYQFFQQENLQTTSGQTTNSGTNILLIAHAINSPYKIQQARMEGAKAIEFDVDYTLDKQNIVAHGPTCGSGIIIAKTNLKYIKSACKIPNKENIMTLQEMLKTTKNMFDLYILEIKVDDPSKAEEQTLAAIQTVQKLNMQDKVVFISYDRTATFLIGGNKTIRAGRDTYNNGDISLIKDFPHEFYLVNKELISPETSYLTQTMNKKFIVYTINTPDDFQKVYDRGAKMIMTDNIPLMQQILISLQRTGQKQENK